MIKVVPELIYQQHYCNTNVFKQAKFVNEEDSIFINPPLKIKITKYLIKSNYVNLAAIHSPLDTPAFYSNHVTESLPLFSTVFYHSHCN